MKILIDMNLSPAWVEFFTSRGIESAHWSDVGDPKALDSAIMDFARENRWIVFTHDLDFGNILAVTHPADQASFRHESRTPYRR